MRLVAFFMHFQEKEVMVVLLGYVISPDIHTENAVKSKCVCSANSSILPIFVIIYLTK